MSLKRAFIMFFFVVILPACTCNGVPIEQMFPLLVTNPDDPNEVPNSWMKCDELRLTSPRDGLPNGMATIYWDPISHTTGYDVELSSNGALIARWTAKSNVTNLTADVSQAAVGGDNPFTLKVIAYDQWNNTCTDSVTLDREAPPRQAPLLPTATATPPPPPTPDCEADPFNENC